MSPGQLDVAVMSVAAAADLASTEYALRTCSACSEANPFMREPVPRYALKAAGVAGASLITRELRKSGHPRAAKVLRWTVVAVWMGLAVHNLQVAKR